MSASSWSSIFRVRSVHSGEPGRASAGGHRFLDLLFGEVARSVLARSKAVKKKNDVFKMGQSGGMGWAAVRIAKTAEDAAGHTGAFTSFELAHAPVKITGSL